MNLKDAINNTKKINYNSINNAKKRFDNIAKPLNSLGKLENIIIKTAGIVGDTNISFDKKCVVVMCSDNGVIDEGVSQSKNDITTSMSKNIAHGKATVNVIANHVNCDVYAVDVGVKDDILDSRIINMKIKNGTNNMLKCSAMSREDAIKSLEIGINLMKKFKENGYNLVATGEMGIGNTTTSSAVASVLLGITPNEMTGRGAGLSTDIFNHKIDVINRAIAKNFPNQNDAIDVLSKVGGFDIGAMAGIFIGAAVYGVPALIDGVISAVSALVATRICPSVVDFIFATHVSKEPASRLILKNIGLDYLIDCGMCLGEGTGAVLAMPMFDIAAQVYNNMSTFDDFEIEKYTAKM